MIDLSALLKQNDENSESLRYAHACRGAKHGVTSDRGPVVAWNITRQCNFSCRHCYSDSGSFSAEDELGLDQIKDSIDQMKALKVPVILLSGGEPLIHNHIFEIIDYIRSRGIRVSLSTNGSLIDEAAAQKIKDLGVSYVGISLDGLGATNDCLRGVNGAFEKAVTGIRNCLGVGQKVGLRMTVYKENIAQIPQVLGFMEEENIDRICFYHLVPSGRGSEMKELLLTPEETRRFVSELIDYTSALKNRGVEREILTVANHTDGPFTYIQAQKKYPELAEDILKKLTNNRGNRSGVAILNMDWLGNVYPDQFSRFIKLGNITEDTLETIWVKGPKELTELRDRRKNLNRECLDCRWYEMCGGNLRARAYMMTGDLWAKDPGCYLREDEK